MLPSINQKQQIIDGRRDERLAEKETLLMVPEVQWNLSKKDMDLALKSVKTPIRKLSDQELLDDLKIQVKYICRDVGISYWEDEQKMKYDGARFFTTVKKYYDDFSVSEIKLAFELSMLGDLDQWLPKDRNGKPDANHYNSFNVAYYTKILNAYKMKRGRVWNNARKLVPIEKHSIPLEERKRANKFFIDEIYNAFDDYLVNNNKPSFTMSMYLQEFVDQKLIKSMPEIKKSTIDFVYRNALMTKKGRIRKQIIDEYHRGNHKGLLLNDYQVTQNNMEMTRIFDEIIKQKKHLKDYLKYRYDEITKSN